MRLNYLFYVFITMILGILFVTQSYLILFLFLGVIILANIRHLNRDIVVFIVVALTPLERVIPFFTLTLPQILMIKYFVLIFLMLFWLLKEKNVCFPVKDRKYINYWIGAFFSLIFLSTVNSINIFESIKGTLPIATGFIAFLFFYNYFKSEIELRKVMYLFLLITFIVSLIACLQLIIIKFNVLNFLESFILPPRLRAFSRMKYMSEMPDLIRISGTFYHPNLFGSFLNYMFFFSILVLMQKKLSKLWRLIAISSTVLTVISIYGTNSRSTILGILCGLTFILFWKKRKLFIWGLLVSILFSSTLLFTGLLNENIEDSVHSGRGISYRDIIWKNAFGIILESPILGYGINTYPYVHSQNI
ncbi:MAG: O-antigen ligase family protein, partial [Candidatus Aureabacteria bacterium]|nr:O-antigen ligase family protein [Candidatus Auribacterota bacterium]